METDFFLPGCTNARDLIGLPVIWREAGPDFGKRVGTVVHAEADAVGIKLSMNVALRDFKIGDEFSVGP